MADVFISYARADAAIARRVASALQIAGFDVWWDADLPAHRSYSEVIESKLAEAKAVVVLWSKAAAQSQWVRAEADFARNAGKLVQASVDDSLPPMPFNQIQCAGLKGWRGKTSNGGWRKIETSVGDLARGERPAQIPASSASRTSFARYRWWVVAAAALLVVAIGAYLGLGPAGVERRPVLAVLPFKSLDAHDESLVAGMWDDTRTAIGRNPQFVVLGPNSARQLADKDDSAAKKAADYIVQASVRTAGDRVRVSAGLVRTRDGVQMWSQDFDRKLDDVFALQSEIASEIEGRVRGRLAQKGGLVPEHFATSGEVYALYSDARAKIRKRNYKDFGAARDQLEQLVEMDPNFAPGWATLSEVNGLLPLPSQRNVIAENPAQAYAPKAIDLAPNLAAGHAALALALHLKGPIAKAALERAVRLDPSDYEALNWLAGMLRQGGQTRPAIQIYDRAVKIEPLFWPAVLNMYSILQETRDNEGIARLLEHERTVGAGYFAISIEMGHALKHGELAKAANLGLKAWSTGEADARALIGIDLNDVLLQLGYGDQVFAAHLGPAPAFAKFLWHDDPHGLEMVEASRIPARTLLTLSPLVMNAGRVYLLTGQSAKFATLYLSLGLPPEQYAGLFDDPEDFLVAAPLVGLALQRNGHAADAKALLAVAEDTGKKFLASGKPQGEAWLARIYLLQGRKDEAISSLSSAVRRRWLPPPPALHNDLATDPVFALLKSDARFEPLRQQILVTIARERAQVNQRLLAQLKSA